MSNTQVEVTSIRVSKATYKRLKEARRMEQVKQERDLTMDGFISYLLSQHLYKAQRQESQK